MHALSERFDQLRGLLGPAKTVVVTGHENADGDAVGAVGALRRHLEMEGKQVLALLSAPLSPRYGFMEFARSYEVYEPARHDGALDEADVLVFCDLSSLSRLGPIEAAAQRSRAPKVCIDHHPCEGDGPADLNVLDETATATGRLVFDYIEYVGGRVDREVAESVFVSLSTDTGWFRYPNTTPSVMGLVARLCEHRLDLPAMYRAIYQSNSAGMLRLMGHVARTMNEECDGAFVWAQVRREFIDTLAIDRYESDPILDVLRSGESVQVVALFTEQKDGRVAVSLRSRGDLDMNAIARHFGGGGHVYAAGATLPRERAAADQRAMVHMLRKLVVH